MSDTYFSKFPTTTYNGKTVVDITRRAAFANTSLGNPFLFYPVTIQAGQRSDQVARKQLGDPYQEWLIWLGNKIVDPYNSWYMDQAQFNDFITQKYGSIPLAQQTVLFYQYDYTNQANINISTFDALDISLMKYYEPYYNDYGQIINYVPVKADWSINTNHLVSFNFMQPIPQFFDNEIVTINYSANQIGYGQVASCSSNVLNIQHVSGYYTPTGGTTIEADYTYLGFFTAASSNSISPATFSITGSQSNSVATVSNTSNIIIKTYDTLSNEEEIFYSPVYAYDLEDSKNESNKIVQIMIPSYVPQTSRQLTRVLNS